MARFGQGRLQEQESKKKIISNDNSVSHGPDYSADISDERTENKQMHEEFKEKSQLWARFRENMGNRSLFIFHRDWAFRRFCMVLVS